MPTTAAAAIHPRAQRSSVPLNNPLLLGLGLSMGPRHFKPTDSLYLFPATQESVFASNTAMMLYEHELQNHPFSPIATLGSSAFIPPYDGGSFNPGHAPTDFPTLSPSVASTTEKQVVPPIPAHSAWSKHQKLNELLADQQVPSIGLPPANEGPTNTIMPPIPLTSFDWPKGISREVFVRLLHARIAAESELNG
jgi:hypothetical protein